jgi:hypothetical protein
MQIDQFCLIQIVSPFSINVHFPEDEDYEPFQFHINEELRVFVHDISDTTIDVELAMGEQIIGLPRSYFKVIENG